MIEDIQYLLKHSKKEDFIMFVDSSMRNKSVDVHPSEYTIVFDECFKNVYGVEILDMLVPRTQYNIDVHNNVLYYAVGGTMNDPAAFNLASMPVQDYVVADLYVAMNQAMTGVTVSTASPSNPMESGKYAYTSNLPFAIDLARSTMREALGFDELARTSSALFSVPFGDERIVSVRNQVAAVTVPFGAVDTSHDVSPGAGVVLVQSFTVPADCDLSSVTLATGLGGASVRIMEGSSPGTAENVVVPATSAGELSNLDGDTTRMHRLSQGQTYFVIVTCDASTTFHPVGPNDPAAPNVVFELAAPGGAWAPSPNGFLVSVVASINTFSIYTPGLITLIGTRCILLHMNEIEKHINSSYIYGANSPGMAMIKLGVQGYQQTRFDFTSIRYREFVPIAKLPQMTFRFVNIDGTLYDFKGVNHTMLILIKYLTPYSPDLAENYKPILNPNYKPDFLMYLRENQKVEDILAERTVQPNINEIEAFYEERYADL